MSAVGELAWIEPALASIGRGERVILVTVAQTRGSTPREAGAKMLIRSDGIAGTVGGGHLEFKAIAHARAMLCDPDVPATHIERFSLGPELAQCCGGSAALLFEALDINAMSWLEAWAHRHRSGPACVAVTHVGVPSEAKPLIEPASPLWNLIPAAVAGRAKGLAGGHGRCALVELRDSGDRYLIEAIRPAGDHLYLFGAGHVGRAVIRAIEPLPFRITWIDGRDDAFPKERPPHVRALQSADPAGDVDRAPAGALFLVMTHSHPLDLEICARVLRRNDVAYLGLIGSETKRARFAGRLRAIGIPPQALARLTCPIGIPGIVGKEPAVIAASVAAQLLIVAGRRQAAAIPSAAGARGVGG